MSLAPDVPTFSLSDRARRQLEERGMTRSQLLRVLMKPVLIIPGLEPGERRLSGYGLTVLTGHGPDGAQEVLTVEIDGATRTNWSDWAIENAEFGDGDVFGADQLVAGLGLPGLGSLGSPLKPKTAPSRSVEPMAPIEIRQIPSQGRPGAVRAPRRPVAPAWAAQMAARVPPRQTSRLPVGFLAQIDADLHDAVTEQCEGDFSRVIVLSRRTYKVLPPF